MIMLDFPSICIIHFQLVDYHSVHSSSEKSSHRLLKPIALAHTCCEIASNKEHTLLLLPPLILVKINIQKRSETTGRGILCVHLLVH